MKKILFAVILAALIFAVSAFGQKGTVIEKNIKFGKGKDSATVKGTVESRIDSHIFHVKAKKGQTLTVVMTSPKPLKDAHLCVVYPNGGDSFCKKRKYVLTLPKDGDYEIYIEAIREPIQYAITVTLKK